MVKDTFFPANEVKSEPTTVPTKAQSAVKKKSSPHKVAQVHVHRQTSSSALLGGLSTPYS